MTISNLYDAALLDDNYFLRITGIIKKDFYLLLAHFNLNSARVLTPPQKLFAVLYAENNNIEGVTIGKLIPYKNYKRDGDAFLEKAKVVLAKARVTVLTTTPLVLRDTLINVDTQQLLQPIAKKTGRKITGYEKNITMGLAHHGEYALDPELIIEHAQRRVDLFFYTIIAYYKAGLTVHINETKLQHGAGTANTAACHSTILPSLCETEGNTKISMLDGTHFYNSLNSTVELHQAVNYFETHYLEGKKSEDKMRNKSICILNRASQGSITPIQGMIEFLVALNTTFDTVRDRYFNKEELKTSPKNTRQLIYDCEKKGSFYSNWHENKDTNQPSLNDDYVNTILQLTPEDMALLKKQDNETNESYLERFSRDQADVYEKKYHVIRREMGLHSIESFGNSHSDTQRPTGISLPAETVSDLPPTPAGLLVKQGFFSTSETKPIATNIDNTVLQTPSDSVKKS